VLARRLDHGWLATTTGGGQPIGFDALGEQTRPLSEQPLALGRGLLAQRLVAFAAALEEGCGLLGTTEGHGWGRDELAQERDIVSVAEQLRDRARGIDSGCELRWPTRREQLHLPPMMLHALAPIVQILVMRGAEGLLKRRARRSVAAPQPFGEGVKIVGIDRKAGEWAPDLAQGAHGIRGGAPLEVLLGGMTALFEPGAHGMDRSLARTRLGLPLELVNGIDQRMRIARRSQPTSDCGDPLSEAGKDRLGHSGAREKEQRPQPLQALTCVVHAAVTVRRARERGLSDVDLAKGDATQGFAHGYSRIETITHRSFPVAQLPN